jgi:hypothetical protein
MSGILIHLLKTVVGTFILNIIGVNIVGFVIGAIGDVLKYKRHLEKVVHDDTFSEAAKMASGRETLRMLTVARVFSMFYIGLQFGFVYILYRQWGWPMAIAGIAVMLDRAPDRFRALETGGSVLKKRSTPHVALSLLVNFVVIPVLVWIALGK